MLFWTYHAIVIPSMKVKAGTVISPSLFAELCITIFTDEKEKK
jgi:hypothetical protein